MINPTQFRELIVRPVLQYLEPEIPYSEAAEDLLVGTAMQESLLTYVRQHNNGPALGFFQMEPATYSDLLSNYLAYRPDLDRKVCTLAAQYRHGVVPAKEMIANIPYAVAMARVHYWRAPAALPDAGDVAGMAGYYKKYFNTVLGKATENQFIRNYELTKQKGG